MNLAEINKEIYKSTLKSSSDFLNTYLDHEDAITEALRNFKGIKTELYLKEVNNELDGLLRFSSIFSDLTVLNNTADSGIGQSHFTYFDPDSQYFRDRELTFERSQLDNLDPSFFDFTPIYFHRPDKEIKTISKKYSSFITSNKLMVRPLRGIYAHNKLSQNNILHYVDPNSDNQHWIVDKANKEDIILANGLSYDQGNKLFELTLPYFTDISIDTLSKILTDENDLLSGFRITLKTLIKNSGDEITRISEMQHDLIDPELDKINRKFKNLKALHRKSIMGAVGSFTLSMLLWNYTESDLAKLISPFVVVGAFVAGELKAQDDLDKLKDNNYFLLWRINRNKGTL